MNLLSVQTGGICPDGSVYRYEALEKQKQEEEAKRKKERALQKAVLSVKKKFGKNAILKGMNLEEGATGTQRNNQIGGHRA